MTDALTTVNPTALHQAARRYVSEGLPIFPCEPDSKVPLAGRSWKEPITSIDEVDALWSKHDFNIGLALEPLGFVAIDLDPGAEECWAKMAEDHGKITPGIEQETPRGGRHLVFAGTLSNSASKLGPHIDIRGKGGYIVIAPSIIGGKSYRVLSDLDFTNATLAGLPPVPEWIEAKMAAASPSMSAPPDFKFDLAWNVERARAHARNYPAAIEGEGGDNHTYELACDLRDLGVSPETVLDILRDWNVSCVPPWSDEELIAKVERADAYGQNAPGCWALTATTKEVFGAAVRALGLVTVEKRSRFRPMRRDEYADLPLPRWMIKGLMPETGIGLLIGHSGSFKTFIAAALSVAVATGRDAFDNSEYPVRRTGAVVMAAGEGAYQLLTQRIPALEKSVGGDFSLEHYPHFVLPALPQASQEAELNEFISETREATAGGPPVRLITLDTLNAMGAGLKENVAEDMAQLMRAAGRIRDAFNCFVLVLHHPPKSAQGEDIDARGSGALRAGADCLYTVVRERERAGGNFLTKLIVRKMKDGDEDLVIYLKGKRIDLGINADGDRISSLSFSSIGKADYDTLTRPAPDDLPSRIHVSLKSLEAYGLEHEVTTHVLAEGMLSRGGKPNSPEEHAAAIKTLGNQLVERIKDDARVRPYARRDGGHRTAPWKWSLPPDARPGASDL